MGTRNAVGHLSQGEERWLLRRLASGDQDARRRLIEAYLGMVSALGRRYARRWGVPVDDLLQEGALALVQAVDHYDPDRGMKLSTYATWWVKQAIRRAAMAQSRPVRIPERLWKPGRGALSGRAVFGISTGAGRLGSGAQRGFELVERRARRGAVRSPADGFAGSPGRRRSVRVRRTAPRSFGRGSIGRCCAQ